MTDVKEISEYSDLVTETLLATNHPDSKWLAADYVTVLDYATSPSVDAKREKQYEQADIHLNDHEVTLNSLLNPNRAASDYYALVMNQVEDCLWIREIETHNRRIASRSAA